MASTPGFHEGHLPSQVIRELELEIAGTPLEALVTEFEQELDRAGIHELRPRFYLSTEWGVPFGTIAIGVPFYLARPDLVALQAERVGHVEGFDRDDILKYFRHEMGHVVNYAYKLYEDEEWVKVFGSITQPYREEYRPEIFSTRFVQHLPGWYAQKHPDEDWSETFAVWMTPGGQWRERYAGWSGALRKLEFCDAKMAELQGREPLVTEVDLDEHVRDLAYTVDEFYGQQGGATAELPAGLDGALRAIFEDLGQPELSAPSVERRPASELMRKLERPLIANVFRWTGHFPEHTRGLLRHLAERADALEQVYPADRELAAALAIATFVTALATNHVHSGNYMA